jgi:hypothetical protein
MGSNLDEAEFASAFDLQKTHDCARIRISRVSCGSEEGTVRLKFLKSSPEWNVAKCLTYGSLRKVGDICSM